MFVRQPELSTTGPHGTLLLAIYRYFAETERDYSAPRTKQGLAAARAQGKTLGRPQGSRNKQRVLDPAHEQQWNTNGIFSITRGTPPTAARIARARAARLDAAHAPATTCLMPDPAPVQPFGLPVVAGRAHHRCGRADSDRCSRSVCVRCLPAFGMYPTPGYPRRCAAQS